MVVFSSYTGPMDRNYGKSNVDDTSTSDIGLGVKDIGMSVPMGIAAANVQGLNAKMRQGASALEIQFPGAVKGSRNAHTPGMYGDDQRRALRELAEINEVNLTTHASMGIMGLAGMDQQGNFSKEQKKLATDEIKRAIEFAADTAKGGSVVVHTGEFQRPLSEEEWAWKDPNNPAKGHRFKHHGEEPERAIIRVVDDRTGQVIQQVRKNMEVARPVWLTADKDYVDMNGNPVKKGQFIDYEGRLITDLSNRVPLYNEDTGRFEVEAQRWDDFVNEARLQNEQLARQKGIPVSQLSEDEKVLPEEAFLKATLQTNEGHSKGWALQYAQGFGEHQKDYEKLQKAKQRWEQIEKNIPEEERWKITRQQPAMRGLSELGIVPREDKLPSELIDEQIKDLKHRIEFEHQASTSQQQQALDSFKTQEHVKSARKYALQESYDSYSDAGIYAYDVTRNKKTEKPLVVTMENIFPESYGGHPQELKNLILGSRKKMAQKLNQQRNIPMEKANKIAQEHIKATIDTAHLNTWRKYWQNDPKKSMNQNDEDFKKWFLEQLEDLAKNKLIGNVHLSDNYGYQDDHLAPGEGTAPNKEAARILKKYGYKDAITVEPGADASTDMGDFWGLMKTWRLFGSPVYGAHGPARMDVPKGNWSDIQYSYFGQAKAPYYIFGNYAPSQDWTLWSQTPFE